MLCSALALYACKGSRRPPSASISYRTASRYRHYIDCYTEEEFYVYSKMWSEFHVRFIYAIAAAQQLWLKSE